MKWSISLMARVIATSIGLAASLRAQGKSTEADRAQARFQRAWATADVPPPTFAARR